MGAAREPEELSLVDSRHGRSCKTPGGHSDREVQELQFDEAMFGGVVLGAHATHATCFVSLHAH
jgi:hypothetical protein